VEEIEVIDEALQRHGLADVPVGSVGLERLKKTAQIPWVARKIPTLNSVIPFLELTSYQEYLVTRIKGTSMLMVCCETGGACSGRLSSCKPILCL
jgi:hypothetical protein